VTFPSRTRQSKIVVPKLNSRYWIPGPIKRLRLRRQCENCANNHLERLLKSIFCVNPVGPVMFSENHRINLLKHPGFGVEPVLSFRDEGDSKISFGSR